MPVTPGSKIPSLRRHRPTGLAVVTLTSPHGTRRDYYCGAFGSQEAVKKYQQLLATWMGSGRQLPAADLKLAGDIPLTIQQLADRFIDWAKGYYRRADGMPTAESDTIERTVGMLTDRFGQLHPAEFSPNKLRELRDSLIEREYGHKKDKNGNLIPDTGRKVTRGYINAAIRRIKQMFKWAESREFVPGATYHRLATVEYLKPGRSAAREGKGLTVVDDATINATLKHLPRAVAGIVQMMRYTGCRCGEAVQVCTRFMDMTEPVWRFTPPQHKNRHRGKPRVIYLGAHAQKALRKYVQLAPDRAWFRPCDAFQEHLAERRRNRETKLYDAHVRHMEAKRRQNPQHPPGEWYDTLGVGRAIAKAGSKADVPHWSPHMLRHSALTKIRAKLGVEVAAAVAGHATIQCTENYTSTVTEQLALRAVTKLG